MNARSLAPLLLALVACQTTAPPATTPTRVTTPSPTAGTDGFASLDLDRDGTLAARELEQADPFVQEQADQNKDGQVTQAEYTARFPSGHEPSLAFTPPRAPEDPLELQRARQFYLTGSKLLAQKQPQAVEKAIHELQLALTHDPTYYQAHFKLGICYYHKGQYNWEISEYKKCLAINPQYVHAWLNLGHAHLARDELEQAREAYERVLELEPGHPVALYNQALVMFDLGQKAESLRLFRDFLRLEGQENTEMGERARRYVENHFREQQ